MSKFSDKLDEYILRAEVKESQLAKVSGISRSYISKIRNGQSIPSQERIYPIFQILNLTSLEYEELCNLYYQVLGKEQQVVNVEVMKFISSFRDISLLSGCRKCEVKIPDIKTVHGKSDVLYMIQNLIDYETSKSGLVRLFIQPNQNETIMNILKSAFKTNVNLSVRHIVCFDSIQEKKAPIHNIQLLKALVPVILCNKNIDYKANYYYERIDSHLNNFSIMPWILIVSDYVLNIDYNLEKAVLIQEKEIRDIYIKKFDSIMQKTSCVYQYLTDDMLICRYSNTKLNSYRFNIANQPYFGVINKESLINQFINSENQQAVEGLKNLVSNNRDAMKTGKLKFRSYFTKKGIERLMITGVIDEIPQSVYKPIDNQLKIVLLEDIIKMAKEGNFELYLIDEHKYDYPEGLIINTYDEDKVEIVYQTDLYKERFMIMERTLAKLFYNFMDKFYKSPYVYSKEESLDYLMTKKKELEMN